MSLKTILLTIILIILAVTLVFIFYNSSLSGTESKQLSGVIVNFLRPIIDPNGEMSTSELQTLVRKTAHFMEFFVCGLCLAFLSSIISSKAVSPWTFMPLFLTLLIAVSDEFLQLFTKRTSLVSDVLIDFSGGLAGIILATLIYAAADAVSKRNKQRKRRKNRYRSDRA